MRGKRLVSGAIFLFLAFGGSCGEKISISGHTVGLIKFIRPDVTVASEGRKTSIFEDERFLPGTEIETSAGSRATIIFDTGVKLVADENTRIKVTAADDIEVPSGRVFVSADEKEQLSIRTGGGKLVVTGSSASLQTEGGGGVKAYTYGGELTYNFPAGSGVARAGESVVIRGKTVDIRAEELWNDWTGGMAEAGPRPMETPTSIGQIYARLPQSGGMMRSPLIIRRHEVRITIKGDLAITETMQQFFNPSSQVMEGIYRLRIPADAILQRFAVDRNGKLIEGTILERKTAKGEYDSHVYQGSTSDPALLEWVGPGSFRASIYPLKPGQIRTVAYTYSQWLVPSGKEGRTRTYVYPIGNETIPPQIGEFYLVADVRDAGSDIVQAGDGARIEKGRVVFAQSDFRPRSDFYIQLMNVQSDLEDDEVLMVKTDYRSVLGQIKGQRSEVYARTQFVLRDDGFELQPRKDLKISVTVDMSAATEQQMVDLAQTFLDSLFGQLHEEDLVAVFAGDIDAQILGEKDKKFMKATAQAKEAILDAAGRHSIGGATDIGKLIMEAASVSSKEPGGIVIYIGDGFPTVGELDLGSLKERIKRLPNPVRLYGIALGDEANLDLLTGLCSGRGLAARITDRVGAAETAISLLADASTPVLENITYEIDGGIERVYPADFSTLKISDPLALIGRLTGEKDPETITVKGTGGGKPFEKKYRVKIDEVDDFGDLRMRWAEKRLQTLLEEQEGPESVIELGTRYGIITPYTSFYVPPEEETSNYPEVQPFKIYNFTEGAQSSLGSGGGGTMIAEALVGIFLPYGCSKKEDDIYKQEPTQPGAGKEYALPVTSEQAPAGQPQAGLDSAKHTVTAVPAHPAEGEETEKNYRAADKAEADYKTPPPSAGPPMVAPPAKKAYKKAGYKYDEGGSYGLKGSGTGGGGIGYGAPAGDDIGGKDATALLKLVTSPEGASAAIQVGLSGGGESYTKTKIYVETESYGSGSEPVNLSDRVKKCTEASLMPIDEKVTLWKERLGAGPSLSDLVSVFNAAKKSCEIKTENDRRAYARLALRLQGSVYARCQFYQSMKPYPALAGYIRGKILASLTTPDAVKTAMQQCDGSIFLSELEVDKMLAKIAGMDARIVALKKLINLYPNDLGLKLRLLDLLEDAGRKDEAVRFADALRKDPYASDEVRTRVGDFYMRAGLAEEAKRIFSEIVEFAPWSYEARRRLGDLYRTYGWHEDAYRQYETLSQMAPNDDAVLILLAEAAILAGRSDEGLRIMQQVSQSEPSFEGKITPSEIARILASLQLIAMRVDARKSGDAKKLKQVADKTRSSGVLRDAAALKMIMKWDHPDASFALTVKYPGSELGKPSRSASSMGLEWTSDKNKPQGEVLLQIERAAGSALKVSKATLIVMIDEGKDGESIQKIPVDLTKKDKPKLAWTLSPDGKIAEAKIEKAQPLTTGY